MTDIADLGAPRSGSRRPQVILRALLVAVLLVAACSGSDQSRPVQSDTPAESVLPAPTGPYAVGVRDLSWAGDGAQLRAWYPAEPGTGDGAPPYLSPDLLREFRTSSEAVAAVRVAASMNASPLAGIGRLPVVVFVPFGSHGSLSTVLMQELASHGYLALLAEPTANLPDATDAQVTEELVRTGRIVDRVVAATDEGLIGAADPARIAIGGHSAGGSFAFEFALTDPRVAAVFDLDGALVRRAAVDPVLVPAMVVMTELGLGGHRDAFAETFSILAATPAAVVVGLEGADHFDPLDAPTIAPYLPAVAQGWPLGPVGATATQSTAELVQRFLNGALGENGDAPSGSSLVAGVPAATATADFLRLG